MSTKTIKLSILANYIKNNSRNIFNIAVRENLEILFVLCMYLISVYITIYLISDTTNLRILKFNKYYTTLYTTASCAILIFQIINNKTNQHFNLKIIINAGLIFLLLPVFGCTFASYKQLIPIINSFTWDSIFMRIDRLLHFGFEPWELFKFVLNNHSAVQVIDIIYMLWFPILFLFCVYMGWTNNSYLRKKFFISTLLVWCTLGSFFGTILSSAGPCYFDKVTHHPSPYEPLMQKLQIINNQNALWAIKNQNGLWNAMINKDWLPFGGISAMPSIHVAMSVIFLLSSYCISKVIGIFFLAYLVIIQVGSIVLGWHYAIDGYVSIMASIFIWAISGKIINYTESNIFSDCKT